jgi:hypothetical protein
MEDGGGAEWLDGHGAKPEVLPEESRRLPLSYAHFLSSAAAVLLSLLHRGFLLKELCDEMNNFLKVIKVKSVLSVHAPIVFKFLAFLVQEKNMYKVSACFFVNIY